MFLVENLLQKNAVMYNKMHVNGDAAEKIIHSMLYLLRFCFFFKYGFHSLLCSKSHIAFSVKIPM